MAIEKWSPLKELEEMKRDMDRLFEELAAPTRRRSVRTGFGGPIVLSLDMFDRDGSLVIQAELPGVKREDIELSITKEALTMKGELKRDEDPRDDNCHITERTYGAFSRTVALPCEVDGEKALASMKDGVLEIVLPKKEPARAKEIKIAVK